MLIKMGAQNERILIFEPHPDDVAFQIAGSAFKWKAEGREIMICTVTTGNNSTFDMNVTHVGEKNTEKAFAGPLDNKDGKGRFVINGNYNSLDGGLAEWCSATIDEVLIFDEVLSQEQIKSYMENGFKAGSPVEPSGKLASTWAQVKTSE